MAEANGKFGNLVIPKAETVSLIEPGVSPRYQIYRMISWDLDSPDSDELDRDMNTPAEDPLVLFRRAGVLT